jgi:alkylated DNA repair dioxygenase AlkB
MRNKARITIPIDKYWKEGTDYCKECLNYARKYTSLIPDMDPQHCLLNYYRKGSKLGWHSDRVPGFSKEEQEQETAPVVSISVGDDGDFMVMIAFENN